MASSSDFPSGWSTGVNGTDRTWVEPPESLGTPADAPATEQNETNSAFALAKGILANLGLRDSDDEPVNTIHKVNPDLLASLGSPNDPPATNATGNWSAISLLKGILSHAGI